MSCSLLLSYSVARMRGTCQLPEWLGFHSGGAICWTDPANAIRLSADALARYSRPVPTLAFRIGWALAGLGCLPHDRGAFFVLRKCRGLQCEQAGNPCFVGVAVGDDGRRGRGVRRHP